MYTDYCRVISSSGEWIRKRGLNPEDIYPFQNSSIIRPALSGIYANISTRTTGSESVYLANSFICEYLGNFIEMFL